MDTVIVTGGAGFIGSSLVEQLARDHRVVVIDNLANGKRENLQGLPDDRVQLLVADIRTPDAFLTHLRGAKALFHLACLGVRHSIHSPVESHEVNASATLALLIAARDAGIPRFVHVSTSEVYGTARTVPMTEEHPTYPCTVYGAAKLAGECYARAFSRTYGYSTVVVRPFNAFGPRCHHEGDSGEVIPKFMLRALDGRPLVIFGDGQQTRDFTYVEDTARGIALAGFASGLDGETINIGAGQEITIQALAGQVGATVGVTPQVVYDVPRPGDVLRLYADTTKARETLGFQPTVTIADGLQRLKDWYLSRPESIHTLLEQDVVHNWEATSPVAVERH